MKFVVDTHALIWFLTADSRLSSTAKGILQAPENSFILPATALAEACWIVERGRIPTITSPTLVILAINSDSRFTIAPLDQIVIEKSNLTVLIKFTFENEKVFNYIKPYVLLIRNYKKQYSSIT